MLETTFWRGLALRSRVLVVGRREGRKKKKMEEEEEEEGQNLEIAFGARVILG